MLALHGAAASREIEAQALAAHPPMTLMRRAGASVARLVLATARPGSPVVVLTGAGHNGGDGWVAAQHVHAAGWPVRVWEVVPALAADARRARADAIDSGVKVLAEAPWPAPEAPVDLIRQHGLVIVDALLGLGARDGVPQPLREAIDWINRTAQACDQARVFAIDLPSGLETDTGRVLGGAPGAAAVMAHHTLSLLTLKPALFTAEGRECAGRVWFDDLQPCGVPQPVMHPGLPRCASSVTPPRAVRADKWTTESAPPPTAFLVPRESLHELVRHRLQADGSPRVGGHKGRHGDVWLLGGAPGMGGALMLASRAALAAGAGRVHRVELDETRQAATDPISPEVMTPGPVALVQALCKAGQTGSLVVVAGCGGGQAIAGRLADVMHRAPGLVLDADALNALAGDAGLMNRLAARHLRGLRTVLTPHPLEAARLLRCSTAQVQADRLRAAQALADLGACTVVLKGAGSVVASAGQVPWINASGNARLASGGTGDVLAGWIGGAWACRGDAQPCAPDELHVMVAACVHLHGLAAETHAAAPVGGAGAATAVLPASDLIGEMARELMRAAHGHQR